MGRRGLDIDYPSYRKLFENIYVATKITKYRDFQYRLLLHKIVINTDLFKWGKTENFKCQFCKTDDETLAHLFNECLIVKEIWDALVCLSKGTLEFNSPQDIIFNTVNDQTDHIVNFICILTKQYIYRCRCQGSKPTVVRCKKLIESI